MEIIFKILNHFFSDSINFISHQPTLIRVMAAALTFCCGCVILLIWKNAISEERWALLLGIACIIYALEYSSRSIVTYLANMKLSNGGANGLINLITAFGSCLINILFFASARDLLRYKKRFPLWSYLLPALCTLLLLFCDESLWSRIPDAVISAAYAGFLGYAISRNIEFHPDKALSAVAISVAVIYGGIQIFYGLSPYVAQGRMLTIIYPPLKLGLIDDSHRRLELLDTIVVTIVLFFMLGLFFAALYIAIQSVMVVSTNQARKMLKGLLDGDQEYLSAEGALKSIGEIVRASSVEIHLLLPGRKAERVVKFEWSDGVPHSLKPTIYSMSSAKNQLAEAVIKWGQEIISLKRIEIFSQLNLNHEDDAPTTSIVAMPIRFHGAIIGYLCVKRKKGMAFTRTTVKQIHHIAELIAPVVQSYREISALDQLSFRFTGWYAGKPAINDINNALEEMMDILHDITSPLTTIISINFGFQIIGGLMRADGIFLTHSQAVISDDFARQAGADGDRKKGEEIIRGSLPVKIEYGSENKSNKILIGELVFVVPREKDGLTQPTLVRQYLNRRAIRAIVAEVLLEICRQHLNRVLDGFSVRLSSKAVKNVGEWFYELWRTAREARLIWCVASEMNSSELIGSSTWIKVIEEIEGRPLDGSNGVQCGPNIFLFPLDPPVEETHHIIKLNLRQTTTSIWLGVGRKGFGPELEFPFPWKIFLERFAEMADTSLARLTATLEFQQLQIETAQAQGLATVAVTTGTLHHQLTNLVKDIVNPISAMNDAVSVGKLKMEERWGRLIRSMKDSADTLLNLTAAVMDVTKIDNHSPCNLLEAARNSQRLFAIALEQGKIRLEISIRPDLEVDVPFHVASLAIANLVINAKDALFSMKLASVITLPEENNYTKHGMSFPESEKSAATKSSSRFIWVEAEDADEMIICRVTDNGPGVLPKIRDEIFDLGVTTKQNGSGWGLFLVKRSLQENRGHIELTTTGPEGTQFTIRFPKPRQES